MQNDLSKYLAVRDLMKTGDLLQWRSNSLIGALIRWRTGAEVNHSSLVLRLREYEGQDHRRFTTEALENGTVLHLLSRRLEDFDGECWWYPLKDNWNDKRQAIGEKALALIGIPYDYGSIVHQIFGAVSTDARALFCSEYCAIAYGIEGEAPTPADMPRLGIFAEPVKIL
jgi:hypothetical protein